MSMTYYFHECEEQNAFCDALVQALAGDVTAMREPARARRNMASLRLEGSGDLYHLVTDTLRLRVPPALWKAVSRHRTDCRTTEAIQWRPLPSHR